MGIDVQDSHAQRDSVPCSSRPGARYSPRPLRKCRVTPDASFNCNTMCRKINEFRDRTFGIRLTPVKLSRLRAREYGYQGAMANLWAGKALSTCGIAGNPLRYF